MRVTVNAAAVAAHTHNRHFPMPEQSLSMYRSPATSLQRKARGRKRPSPMTAAPAMSTTKTTENARGDVEGTRKQVEALIASGLLLVSRVFAKDERYLHQLYIHARHRPTNILFYAVVIAFALMMVAFAAPLPTLAAPLKRW
ncbi:uncharacterized protein ARMOST_16636 [Armillaria ostoyae]|uniref:Uncharacterized protein n=1 Tax=Armillaria ostoyae TaxID=47428 RepID=A0A284RWR9_ARMOS|nr:uncharacterized protein ARMOST_16636 [Armillaria ostoyae]